MMAMKDAMMHGESPYEWHSRCVGAAVMPQYRGSSKEDGHMDSDTLRRLDDSLDAYLSEFGECFRSQPSREHLGTYVRGQLGPLQRKCIEPIALEGGVRPRTLQQFIGAHRWDQDRMRTRVREIVARDHSDPNAIGIIDETSFAKKGSKTTGVQRQWCGETGKIDNCVTTVNLSYVSPQFATVVDSDVFIPEGWLQDEDRCEEAGIPSDLVFRKKWKIALDLIDRTAEDELGLTWITTDEFYGRCSPFLDKLEGRSLKYVVEIPVATWGWSARGYARGREHRRVDELFKRGGPPWVDYRVKETTKGPSVWRVRATRFVLHAGKNRSEKWLLIAINPLSGETKYFLSNASEDTPIAVLLTVAFSRWRVERNFQESKQEIGLGHFEVRTYTALQRHVALSMVSLLFLTRAARMMKEASAEKWTLPQTRKVVNTLADQSLSSSERKRKLEHVLRKVAYWQRRNKAAEVSHSKRRKDDLREVGIDLRQLKRCPEWVA